MISRWCCKYSGQCCKCVSPSLVCVQTMWYPFKLCTVWRQCYWVINWTREQNAQPAQLAGAGVEGWGSSPARLQALRCWWPLPGTPAVCPPFSFWELQCLPQQLLACSTRALLVSPWRPVSPSAAHPAEMKQVHQRHMRPWAADTLVASNLPILQPFVA